jgi:hypothetical protein
LTDFVQYYWLERYLFEDVRQRFHTEHSIGAFDLFSIVIWKANRAKSHIAHRLLAQHRDLERAARQLSAGLWKATTERERLELLMRDWGFRLPVASAILTVLWPDQFTVYDERVCSEVGDFSWLANRKPERVWESYCAFRESVRRVAPPHLGLRDQDRFLWGRSTARQLERDLKSGF